MTNSSKIYANAVAVYNGGKLLDKEKLRRLFDAEFSDAVKMLCDYGYGGGMVDEHSYDIDKFISSETTSLIDFVLSNSPSESLSKCLTLRFYYNNAKVLYKSRFTNVDLNIALYTLSETDELKTAVETKDYSRLSDVLAESFAKLDSLDELGQLSSGQINCELNRAYYFEAMKAAKKSRDKALISFISCQIDLFNILTIFRAKAIGYGEEKVGEMIISGGQVPYENVFECLKKDNNEIKNTYMLTPYYEMLEKLIETGDMVGFESATDEFLFHLTEGKSEEMTTFGPFIHYFMSKINEFKVVKTVLVCIKNGARDKIESRIGRWL